MIPRHGFAALSSGALDMPLAPTQLRDATPLFKY
jgi:hypothetical protein